VKWFSWVTWFFLLCLLLIWSSGYWLWSQTVRNQFSSQKIEILQQLEITQNLLLNWQQSYRLNLGYLQKQLSDWDPVSVNNPLLDPWQEVDDKLSHALWQDPLLAYAVLDDSGRVLRLSSNQAGDLFAQTQSSPVAEFFLPPLVMPEQWVVPVLFRINKQSIMLWFDASALKKQIYRQFPEASSPAEFQLISQQGEFWSHSKYRNILLARLGSQGPAPIKLDKFYAKKPPEDLTISRQRFDSSAAWPFTSVFLAMQKQAHGASAGYYPNYLGKPALAAWRWSDAWQAFMVIELDASQVVKQQKSWWRYGFMTLIGLSLFLSLGFYLVQRRLLQAETANDEQYEFAQSINLEPATPNAADDATVSEHDAIKAQAVTPAVPANEEGYTLKTIDLLKTQDASNSSPALLPEQPLTVSTLPEEEFGQLLMTQSPRLAASDFPTELYRQSSPQRAMYAMALEPALAQVLQLMRQKLPQHEIGLELAEDLPLWLELPWQSLQRTLQYLVLQACLRAEKSEIIVRVLLAEQQLLRCEIIDGGISLTEGQWFKLLHPSSGAKDDVLFRKIQRELTLMSAQLSGCAEPNGNKMVLSVPVHVLQQAPAEHQPNLQQDDASALLLSPVGELQHLYRRLLRHTGIKLMPLDDATQFMQWCASQRQQQLDYLLLDEQFVNADISLADKLLQVVRRYFPQVRLLVITAQPILWRSLVVTLQLRLLQKPLVNTLLKQALISENAGLFAFRPQKVWLYQPESLQYWFQEQQLLTLGYQVQKVSQSTQLSGLSANDLVLLPSTLQADVNVNNCRAAMLWTCQTHQQLVAMPHSWLVGQGASALSRQLFVLISSRKLVE
jgi:hypothetical protein